MFGWYCADVLAVAVPDDSSVNGTSEGTGDPGTDAARDTGWRSPARALFLVVPVPLATTVLACMVVFVCHLLKSALSLVTSLHLGGTQDRGESIPEQRTARGMGCLPVLRSALEEESARPTGKVTNRTLG